MGNRVIYMYTMNYRHLFVNTKYIYIILYNDYTLNDLPICFHLIIFHFTRLDADLSSVTHLYVSSLCFPEPLIFDVSLKLQQALKGHLNHAFKSL